MEPNTTSMTTFRVPVNHPAFDGHFPGSPILPGVVLLDAVLRAAAAQSTRAVQDDSSTQPGTGTDAQGWRIAAAKFLSPVAPGETLTLELQPQPNRSIRFSVHSSTRAVASGVLQEPAPSTECCHGQQAR